MTTSIQRPQAGRSAKPVTMKVVVRHRSDQLMQEQLDGARNCQEALEKALVELDHCKSEQNRQFHSQQIKELKQKMDDQMLVLKIADKLNREIQYARDELQISLKIQDDSVTCKARKRVVWLEDRMAKLASQKFIRESSTPGTDLSTADSASTASLVSSDSVIDLGGGVNNEIDNNELNNEIDNELNLSADESNSTADNDSYRSSGLYGESRSKSEPDEMTNVKAKDSGTRGIVKRKSNLKKRKSEISGSGDQPHVGIRGEGDGTWQSEHSQYSASPADRHPEDVINDRQSVKSRVTFASYSSSSSRASSEISQDDEQEDKGIFITETSALSADAKKSRVAVVSPAESLKDEDVEEDEATVDRGTEYWQTEHHRFEHSDHAQALCDLDPLSYHQVGLAVPGTFIHEMPEVDQELPWRPRRKGSDIKDIHRIALDKLAGRVQKMYEKIYDAAMLSVDPHFKDVEEAGNFLQNFDLEKAVSIQSGNLSSEKENQEKTADPAPTKSKSQERNSANEAQRAAPIRLKYYPKAIPKMKTLPNTQLLSDSLYPTNDKDLTKPDMKREVATRICDQGNLNQETKFTSSLFKSRRKRDTKSAQQMRTYLEKEPTAVSVSSTEKRRSKKSKLQKTFQLAQITTKLIADSTSDISSYSSLSTRSSLSLPAPTKWNDMKPISNALDHSGMKWERVKDIIHTNLVSERTDDRKDAARSLGLMNCGDPLVIFALRQRLTNDSEQCVQYEAAKSLILLGQWDDDILKLVVRYLALGNTEVKEDLIHTMIKGKNVQYVDKKLPYFKELRTVLSHFCKSPDPSDTIAFDAAICLGKLCVADKFAKAKLKTTLVDPTSTTHLRASALDVLVRQMNCQDWDVVSATLHQLISSPVWKHRADAAKLLVLLGPKHVCLENKVEDVYELLERRLWDDACRDVRTDVAKAIMALGMFPRACERTEKRLEDANESIRAQAVISVGTLGIRSERIIKALLEMVELDSSEHVRLQIIRTFGVLGLYNDKRVMRSIKERERLEGVLAREATKVLTDLTSLAQVKASSGRKRSTHMYFYS